MRDGELTYAQQIEMMGHLNAWKARALAAETRAEAAERRAGELEGAVGVAEVQITYLHEKFGETGSGNAVLAKLRRLIGHGEPALLPATQAENPQEPAHD